jgi:hypothetical protein
VNAMNLIKVKFFRLYIDPISNFDDPIFDDFNKLLQKSHDVLPLLWCFNHVELKEHLDFKLDKIMLSTFLTLHMDLGSRLVKLFS